MLGERTRPRRRRCEPLAGPAARRRCKRSARTASGRAPGSARSRSAPDPQSSERTPRSGAPKSPRSLGLCTERESSPPPSCPREIRVQTPLPSVQLFACIDSIDETYTGVFGGGDAVRAVGEFSDGGAAREPEPGGGGDVPDAAHVDGASEGPGGRARGPALREDEPRDAAHGGGEG